MAIFYVCTSYDVFNPKTGFYNTKLDCIEWDTEILGEYDGPTYATKDQCIEQSICIKTDHESNNYCNIYIEDVKLLNKTNEEMVFDITLPKAYENTFLHHALYDINNDLLRDWQPTLLASNYTGCTPEGAAIRVSVLWIELFVVANNGLNQLRRRYLAANALGLSRLNPDPATNETIDDKSILVPNNTIFNIDYVLWNVDGSIINFGEPIKIGFKIENVGQQPLTINLEQFDPSPEDSQRPDCIPESSATYSIESIPEPIINPGDYSTTQISFVPYETGVFCTKLYLTTNDFGGPAAPQRPERPCEYYQFFISTFIDEGTLYPYPS